jgi:azurin
MDTARTDLPSRSPQARALTNAPETIVAKTLLPHPMVRDLAWLQRSIPNPWRTKIEKSRPMRIEARDNLQYSTKILECQAGESIQLTFANPDVVPHNWALLRPNSLEKIGAMANGLVNDPDAYLRHYVPESKDVLCYTDIVEPKEEGTIFFVAPTEPGRYPFLCTFPGHWMVMNGELIVRMP